MQGIWNYLAYRRRRRFRDLAKEVEKEAAKVIRKNAKELEGTAKLMNKGKDEARQG